MKTLTLPLQQQRVSGQTIAVFVVERGYKPLLCFYVPHHFLLNSQVTLEPDTKKQPKHFTPDVSEKFEM